MNRNITVVSTVYSDLIGKGFGGSIRRLQEYLYSLDSILKSNVHSVIYTSEQEYTKIKEHFSKYSHVDVRAKDLDLYKHAPIIKELKNNGAWLGDRHLWIYHFRADLVSQVCKESESDYIFHIDAGLCYRGLFPNKLFTSREGTQDFTYEHHNSEIFSNLFFEKIVEHIGDKKLYFIKHEGYGHIIGGLWGGSRESVAKLLTNYENKMEELMVAEGRLTTDEDIFSLILDNNLDIKLDYFQTWYHENSDLYENKKDYTMFYEVLSRFF